MICERCQSHDGRRVAPYTVKGGGRRFCDDCARLTATVHDISPTPPEAQEAEAEPEPEPEPEAQEAEEPEPERKPSKKKGN